ncbi:MAG: hypothetical protein ACPF9Q_07145, partial [Opitutales bacterium]
MDRRKFIKSTAVALAAQGCLPLLAADAKKAKVSAKKSWGISPNPYVEPAAIEPITGVLPDFTPVAGA